MLIAWRDARAAESARLESVCGETHRGFESHSLRHGEPRPGGRGVHPAHAATRHGCRSRSTRLGPRSNTATCRSAPWSCAMAKCSRPATTSASSPATPQLTRRYWRCATRPQKIGHWRLDDCTLVVTLEPCAMCAGAMVNARLGHLIVWGHRSQGRCRGSCFDLLDGAVLNHRVPRTSRRPGGRVRIAARPVLHRPAAGLRSATPQPADQPPERRASSVGRLVARRHSGPCGAGRDRRGRTGHPIRKAWCRWWRLDRGRVGSDGGDRPLDREHDVVGHVSVCRARTRVGPGVRRPVAASRRGARRGTARRSHRSAR